MAEVGTLSESKSRLFAEGADLEEQIDECIALKAIYENEDLEICDHDNQKGDIPGGIFNIPMYPQQPFFVKMTKDMLGIRRLAFAAAWGRGRSKRLNKDSQNSPDSPHSISPPNSDSTSETSSSSSSKQQTLYPIKRLPPVTLTFSFPHDYPSKSPPNFTLSCCWLDKRSLSKLCAKLDEIWKQFEGTAVIMNWVTFIQEESLQYLGIKSPYDLGRVLVHVFTHPVKNTSKPNVSLHKLTPRPFDSRIFQTFGSIEEVLPTVLDSDLMTCEVCFEEKSGDKFMRLVNCVEHPQCKECVRGWFEEQIKEGAVRDLHCPGYKCEKMVLPTEVAHVVSSECYQRYEKLLLKTAFDVMTDMVHCPRSFCQFPVLLEDNLGVCQQCHHAFCGRCQNTYHGHTPCKLKSELYDQLYQEYQNATLDRRRELEVHYGKQNIQRMINEVKSNQWLESNSKQCPSCSTFIQKKDGCNKMTCSNCRTFFCWLCSEELSRSNPYAHYMHPTSPCTNRLFEGIEAGGAAAGDVDNWEIEDEDDRLFNFLDEAGLLMVEEDDDDNENDDNQDDNDDEDDFIQFKTDGCNRMRCSECGANFCWLCGIFISKQNPYGHFSQPGACNGRLFEGVNLEVLFPEFGDENENINPDFEDEQAILIEQGAFDDAK